MTKKRCSFQVIMNRTTKIDAVPPAYPSSSKKAKDWDKLEVEIKNEEKDEKLEGDAALNKSKREPFSMKNEST